MRTMKMKFQKGVDVATLRLSISEKTGVIKEWSTDNESLSEIFSTLKREKLQCSWVDGEYIVDGYDDGYMLTSFIDVAERHGWVNKEEVTWEQ